MQLIVPCIGEPLASFVQQLLTDLVEGKGHYALAS